MAKRKRAGSELAETICNVKSTTRLSWLERLSDEDRATLEVVREQVLARHLNKSAVARNIKKTFDVQVGVGTICKWLQE